MAYTWDGMEKLTWEEVKQRHYKGELVGCFKLYPDETEGMIEAGYDWQDIVNHYDNGGEFGYEKNQTVNDKKKEDAIKKLKDELEKAKDKSFAEPVLGYLIGRCEEDSGLCEDVCQKHKTWEKCFKYIYEEARKFAKGANQCAVRNDVVYEWAEDYYHKDDKAEEEEKARKEAERKKKEAERKAKAEQKPAVKEPKKEVTEKVKPAEVKPTVKKEEPKPKKSKDIEGQINLFSLMGM